MRIAGWNIEGFSESKQEAAIALAERSGVDAIVFYETWFRESGLSPPRHALWARLDVVCPQTNTRARRGKGGISLLFKQSLNVSFFRACPYSRWVLWTSSGASVAGVYTEPSIDVSFYERSLLELANAIASVRINRPTPVVVVGDFNARMGDLVGDHATNNRKQATLSFVAAGKLALLSAKLRHSPSRWTWTAGQARSIPDLALVVGSPFATLEIVDAPSPTPHRMLVVTAAMSAAEVADDSDRWNWSRRAFSDRERASLCATLLNPVMKILLNLWKFIGTELDSQLSDSESESATLDGAAQALVDEAYDTMCRAVRCALVGMACWSPTQARRGYQAQKHLDWSDMGTTSNAFFLNKVKSSLNAAKSQQAQNICPSEHPSVSQFSDCYRNLFSASAESPHEPFCRSRKLTSGLENFEKLAFSDPEGLLQRARWGKSIGPDNLPADVFKCCVSTSAPMLQAMFTVFWAHQILPSVWRGAFVSPIPKPGADLRDPEQWRGIALQSHTKKLFEVCVRSMCRQSQWTNTHVLQTGFQPHTGAIEAVYAVDELTRKYSKLGTPLSVALLDVRKAYDRTPRALVFRKLRARGMPDHAIGVIQALMDSCHVQIRIGTELSDPVAVELGVPQGDVLSPDMFNVFVDDLPERLISVCSRFGGCPTYGGVDMPVVMYADDQTLLHWNADAMQAMLHEVEAYASEHQYVYNVRKCEVSHPPDVEWPPLLLYQQPIPSVEKSKLLGVKLHGGLISHAAQLTDRLQQADRAMCGLDMLGALRTPHLSIAKKRLLLMAYGRSRIEYGLSIGPHSQRELAPVDTFMRQQTGKFFGSGRGTLLSMRFCGIVPVMSRMSQLRMRFLCALRDRSRRSPTASLAVQIFTAASSDRASALDQMLRRLPVKNTAGTLVRKYLTVFRETFGRDATPEQLAGIDERAARVAVRHHAWLGQERHSKLLKLQEQDYAKPHPAAYVNDDGSRLVGSWLTNLIPGSSFPCPNCDGQYLVSRYHLCRCTDAAVRLGEFYCPIVHATFLTKTDNVMDAMIMDLTPVAHRREAIQAKLDCCPYKLRRRRPGPDPTAPQTPIAVYTADSFLGPPPWCDPEWRSRVTGIGCAIAEIRSRCSLQREGNASMAGVPRIDFQLNSAEMDESNDHVVGPQAFSSHAGSFNAENPRASSPIRPPAR